MTNFYNMDAIRESLKKDISTNNALIEAWKKVSFPTKKDGTAFKVMSKNIVGARYDIKPYLLARGQYELTVTAFANPGGYVSDSINCYELVKYLKDESMKAKTENYQPKEMYLEQVYTFDIEDIKKPYLTELFILKAMFPIWKSSLQVLKRFSETLEMLSITQSKHLNMIRKTLATKICFMPFVIALCSVIHTANLCIETGNTS